MFFLEGSVDFSGFLGHEWGRLAIPTRSQPQMRGLPHIAENFKIEIFEARFLHLLRPH